MKESSRKLLELQSEIDKKLLDEGFFDDFMEKYREKKSDQAIDRAHAEQKAKEKERRKRALLGRAIPPRLYKSTLRKYYTMRAMAIPKELEGLEDDHSAYKRSPAQVGRQTKGKASGFIGSILGLDPDAQRGLDTVMKGAGDAAGTIAGATGAAFNYIKSLFGAEKAREALPQIEKASEEAAKPGSVPPVKPAAGSDIASLSSIANILGGVPSNKKMKYFFIKDFEKSFDAANPSLANTPLDDYVAQQYIDSTVSEMVLGSDRKKIDPSIKSIDWKDIYNNIKKDSINDKRGMGYLSGHYVIVRSDVGGRRQNRIVPISALRAIFPKLDISDLEN